MRLEEEVSRHLAVALLGMLGLASGCGDDEPLRTPSSAPAPHEEPAPETTTASEVADEPDPALAPTTPSPTMPRLGTARERCELETQRTIAPTAPPGRPAGTGVAIAAHRDDATSLVVVDGSEARDTVELGWPDPRLESVQHGQFVRGLEAASLFALEMTGPDAAVLVRTADCVASERAARCLYVRGIRLDRSGDEAPEVTDPAVIAMPSAPSSMRIVATDGRVLLARSHVGAAPALDVLAFAAEEGALRVTSRALGEGLDLDRGPVEILAAAATAGSHAIVFRQGAQEADDSAVTLATSLDEHAVPELQEALVIESIALFTGAVVMVAAFEFSEPSWLRFGMDGELLGEPRRLPAGEAVPIPFSDRRVARVDGVPPRTLEIRDGAGHGTAPLVTLPEGTRAADLARFDGGFLVATLEGDDVRVSALRCRAPSDDNGPGPR